MSRHSRRLDRRILPLAIALALAGLALFAVLRVADLRTDMAEFLPAGQSEAARFMLDEVRTGTAANLLIAGIEGADAPELVRLSDSVAEAARQSGRFALVQNGRDTFGGPEQDFLFENRYLLSPAVTEQAFTEASLRDALAGLLRQLQSSAAPLVQQFGFADPIGAFLALAQAWQGDSRVRLEGGVWFAAGRERALLLFQTRDSGVDIEAQTEAIGALRTAFERSAPGGARLLLSGPPVFSSESARTIQADVERLTLASSLLVAGLLVWRFRSLWALAAIAVVLILSVAVATLAVQMAFGFVHGIAFGFGMTMLGVTVDYPVLLLGHRKRGEAALGTLRRIGPAFVLAVTTAVLGLTGMVFSGFPGLIQLGVFSIAGLAAAALATWWILPRLIVAADLAPAPASSASDLLRIEHVRRHRLWLALPIVLAVGFLLVHPPRWEDDLANLSPVPEAARLLDEELRADLGVPDRASFLLVRGDEPESVLRRQEALVPILDRLRAEGAIGNADFAARYLPSQSLQRARQHLLPDEATLQARIEAAGAGLPFRGSAFEPFAAALRSAREAPPLGPDDFGSPLMKARLGTLLFEREGQWFGPIAPQDVAAAERVTAAFADRPDILAVDIRAEMNTIVSTYTQQAWKWFAVGGGLVVAALGLGLRSPLPVAKVTATIAAAIVVTVALLTASGVRLSVFHIVSLQFVAGVGLDYALFFARRQLDEEERARTLRTLVTCNAMTLLTFGLLAFCQTPLLRDIGTTVAIGALAALLFAFFVTGERPEPTS
ncbi:MMPL family transporter [Marinivivus vitaminiproducens]|uniref:MMPL family transporter n=1 Tax=Marinivivus vitaminiproducens TaxID=3035935 RepID=UPI00279B5596|nr:MMPL family transporter [Geminicoccaceae bacterium SCSIO 64248]